MINVRYVWVRGSRKRVLYDTPLVKGTTVTEHDTEKTPVRHRQLDTTMGTVERFLMGSPKVRGESTRDRVARLMDEADKVRAILEQHMPRGKEA